MSASRVHLCAESRGLGLRCTAAPCREHVKPQGDRGGDRQGREDKLAAATARK